MERRHSGFVVLAALVVFGSLGTHALAYALAQPDAHDRAVLLARTGHAWLAWAPAVVGTAALALVSGLALTAIGAAAGTVARRLHPVVVGIPIVAFAIQETVERALSGTLGPSLYHERFFVLGLGLQAGLGLVCLLVARLLVGGAEELGRLFVLRPPACPPLARPALHPILVDVLRPAPLAACVAGRAPPASAS